MSILGRETKNVQNASLGALLLWRFAVAFEKASSTRKHPNIPLFFIVLPLLFHEELFNVVAGTRSASGLRAFADKFASSMVSKSDVLLSLNERIERMKTLTIESLSLAISSKLIAIEVDSATVIPLSHTPAKKGIPDSVKKLSTLSEKIGTWCAPMTNHEIGLTLKIGL